MTTLRTSLAVVLALALIVAALGQEPPKTRQDILRYGATAIGSPYVWGGGNWDPGDRSFGGADCSGFVSKCWSISRWTPYRVNLHGPSTAGYIQTPGSDWYEIDRAEMLYGDAVVYRYNDNQSGHTYVYISGDGWGEHEVYEARGTDYGIVHRWRTALSSADITKAIRCAHLVENVGVTEHIVETDDGAPAYVDSGMTGSSQYDSYALGCTEGDCRYRWVTAARSETCIFTPDLPEAGWYRVYVTCNEDSPNVHDVGVTVNSALGAARYLWDQADAVNMNMWTPIGDTSFYFDAGSGGAVIWDDYDAWPTTGDHVFRGDATKFVLDNHVVVDGVGGAAGTFATLNAAIAWLAAHASEEPDVIDITCDTLFEPGCVELDTWDDVTINGDADGNGVSVTIIVNPSVPADWSSACGMYLDVPIQHQYTLRDLELIPAYVSGGHAVAAYGLVIDEQNPSGEACGMGVALENVTVAGSLPGNVATDPDFDSRALATMFGGAGSADTAGAVFQRTSGWAGDDQCRQIVTASDFAVTHSAAHGVVLTSAYTDWDIAGGLRLSYNAGAGLKAYQINSSTLQTRAAPGAINRIHHNAGRGVVNAGAGALQIESCWITENDGSSAGGVYSENATTILRNCVIADNANTGVGGAVLHVGGNMTLECCTLANNTAPDGGGAIYSGSGNVSISDSIVWGNGANPLVGGVAASYCDIEGGFAGAGNIDRDPEFVDAGIGDYHLRRISPCINEANPSYVGEAGETDIDGETRKQAAFLDIGADETDFWDGDADNDGDVDGDDFAALADCLAGPGVAPPVPGGCIDVFDMDEDGDVDLRDAAEFRLRAAAALGVPDIILESRNAGGSVLPPPSYSEAGSWNNSTAKSSVPELAGSGSRYITYDLPNADNDNATFVPTIAVDGLYEVFVTWGTGANCYDARYTIAHADGSAVLLVDQIPEGAAGANANTWVWLGQYRFTAGQSAANGSINVSEETVTGKPHSGWSQRVYADAVRFVYVGE